MSAHNCVILVAMERKKYPIYWHLFVLVLLALEVLVLSDLVEIRRNARHAGTTEEIEPWINWMTTLTAITAFPLFHMLFRTHRNGGEAILLYMLISAVTVALCLFYQTYLLMPCVTLIVSIPIWFLYKFLEKRYGPTREAGEE